MRLGGSISILSAIFGAALVEETASFACTFDDESVDSRHRGDLRLGRGVVPCSVDDARITHRPRECINRSSSSLLNLTARPGPTGLRRPSRTALHKVTPLRFVYCAASLYVRYWRCIVAASIAVSAFLWPTCTCTLSSPLAYLSSWLQRQGKARK